MDQGSDARFFRAVAQRFEPSIPLKANFENSAQMDLSLCNVAFVISGCPRDAF